MILDDVITYLVTLFDTTITADVYDGPVPSALNKGRFVLVGSTAEPDEDAATFDREWSDMGPGTWVAESGQVVCSAWSWKGGTDIGACRAEALEDADACAAAVVDDRKLGGLLNHPPYAQVSDFQYQPSQTSEGAIVRVLFTVSYSTRIQ